MTIFLFRNSDNPVEYCATDTRSGHRLPQLGAKTPWLFHQQLQNAVHAAAFGVLNFEIAKREISKQGYLRFIDNRYLRNFS